MNEKFNKNAKVEQLTIVVLSHGEEKGLIVKDPLSFRTLLRSSVTTWSHGAYRNSYPVQVQGWGYWERPWKSICSRILLKSKFGNN